MNAADLFMAFVMLCEAGGGGKAAMRPVGHVIVNRVGDERFGASIRDVLRQPRAFACVTADWHKRMLAVATLPATHPERERWQEAKALAASIRSGRDRDLTRGALFYHAVRSPAVWRHKMRLVATIAGQAFYRDQTGPLG